MASIIDATVLVMSLVNRDRALQSYIIVNDSRQTTKNSIPLCQFFFLWNFYLFIYLFIYLFLLYYLFYFDRYKFVL